MPGKEGYLGILPGHAPLITELGIGTFCLPQTAPTTRFLTVIHGYAEVLPDRVIVLAEISERAEEIDVERTRAAEGQHARKWRRRAPARRTGKTHRLRSSGR